jgi:hypothetical protein
MVGDAEGSFKAPREVGGSTVGPHVYVEDVDALHRQAIDAGEDLPPEEIARRGTELPAFNSPSESPEGDGLALPCPKVAMLVEPDWRKCAQPTWQDPR